MLETTDKVGPGPVVLTLFQRHSYRNCSTRRALKGPWVTKIEVTHLVWINCLLIYGRHQGEKSLSEGMTVKSVCAPVRPVHPLRNTCCFPAVTSCKLSSFSRLSSVFLSFVLFFDLNNLLLDVSICNGFRHKYNDFPVRNCRRDFLNPENEWH